MFFNYEVTQVMSTSKIDDFEDLVRQKNAAYTERNKLVALLSKIYPSVIGSQKPDSPGYEKEWSNIVYVQLPTGQCSWHIHESELHLFSHLEFSKSVVWDGHSTEEKYERISRIIPNKLNNLNKSDYEDIDLSNCRFTC